MVRRVVVVLVAGALLLSGAPGVSAAAPVPGLTVAPGTGVRIALDDGAGTVVFPENGERTQTLLVDVTQAPAPDVAVPAGPGGGLGVLGDVVSVLAQTPAGLAVTSLAREVTLVSGGDEGPVVTDRVVPGVEVSIAVDPRSVEGVDPNEVGMFTRSGVGADWVPVPSAFDPVAGLVVGHSDGLGEFAVLAPAPSVGASVGVVAAVGGPTVVLDPDDDVGSAQFPGEPLMGELDQNLKLTGLLQQRLERTCGATVVVTRGAVPFVDQSLRAQVAMNADPDLLVTLAFNARGQVDENGVPVDEPGAPWGTEGEGGVRAWATASSGGDVAFAERFLDAVPVYTGRPAPTAVNGSGAAAVLPYPALAAVGVTYAHVELLFMDHNFDHPVIRDEFDLVVDAAAAAMIGELRAKGFACDGGVVPERPSAQQLQQLRNLGWQNYQLYGADPVSFSSGNYLMDEPVFSLSGVGDQVIDVNLTYNSQDSREGVFGVGWSFPYNVAYQGYADGGALIRFGDGRSMVFEPGPGGGFVSPPGSNSTLVSAGTDTVELTTNNSERYRFTVDPVTGYGVLASTVDRQGNTMAFTWGAPVGARQIRPLQEIVDEAGQTVTLGATGEGRVGSITHPDGRVWSFTYSGDRLGSVTDARGVTRSFAYGAEGYMNTVTAADGITYVANRYDDSGRVIAQRNATGDVRSFDYQDGQTVYTDALGNETTYVFDAKGQVTETVNALGATTTTAYDTDYNPTSTTDENGNTTRTAYDNQGRPLTMTDPTGAVTTMAYNPQGDLVRLEQPDGHGGVRTTTFEVNSDGRVTTTTFDDSSTQTATFDDHGDRTSVTDQNANTTSFTLDSRGNTVATSDPLGGVSRATFDLANRQLSLTDENGNTTHNDYDNGDNLVKVTDPLGHTTTFGYDLNNQRTSMTDALGRTTTYRFDANLNLIGVTHPDGSSESFTLNSEYGVIASIDGRGGEVRTTYDALLRPVVTIDENGERWTTSYDPAGNPTTLTDPTGATVSLAYDPLDRVVARTDQNGHTWTTAYDPAGNRVRDTAPDGTTITAEFDSLGQLTAAIDEQGNRATAVYDLSGNVVARSDRRGNTTSMTYDPLDRVVETRDPDGGVTRQAYDPVGNTISVTDPLGGQVRTTYDPANRAVTNTDALGAVSTTTYDPVGNPVQTVDAVGQTWHMTYDAMNRMTIKTSPLGDRDEFRYDPNGNLEATVKADGVVTRRVHDGRDRLVQVIENARDGEAPTAAVNVTTTYERNPVGWVVGLVDGNGARTTYDLDGLGQILSQTDPLGRTTTWTYNPVGTIGSKTDGNGQTTTYTYDADRQLNAEVYTDGTTTTFGYDPDNNMISMTDAAGTTTWNRDWRGSETSSTDGNNNTVTHAYDPNGNLTDLGYPDGHRSRRTYDPANRLSTVTDPTGTITYTRDGLGRPTTITHPEGNTTAYTYDAEGNTTTIDHDTTKTKSKSTSVSALLHLDYTYTPDDLVATRTLTTEDEDKDKDDKDKDKDKDDDKDDDDDDDDDEDEGVTAYTYDPLNRLVRSTTDDGLPASYTYDAVGNRLSSTTTDKPGSDKPKDAESVTYTYDAADQLISETRTGDKDTEITTRHYDRNGNQITASTQRYDKKGKPKGKPESTSYTYNLRDELISDGTTNWARDGLTRAIRTIETKHANDLEDAKDPKDGKPQKGVTELVYDRQYVIETVGKDTATFVRSDTQDLLTQTVGKHDTEILLTDLVGTVHGAVEAGKKSADIATFTDFGEYEGKKDIASAFGFAGELQDSETSRIDFLARSYDPTTGRFLQRDKAGQDLEIPRSFHPYQYALNAPTIYTDHLGYFGFSSITNFVSEHKATIASVAVGIAVGAAVAACIGTVVCGAVALGTVATAAVAGAAGAVAAGATYRGLDGDPNTKALSLRSAAIDATIGAVTGGVAAKAAPLVRSGIARVASTKTGQRIAGTRLAQATATKASTAQTAVKATQQRVAEAARTATARASNTTAASVRNIRAGLATSESRTVSTQSGRAGLTQQARQSAVDAATPPSTVTPSITRGGAGPVQQGAAGVERTVADLKAAGGRVLGREITIEAGGVRTRPDLFVELPCGTRCFLEVKAGPGARPTTNQATAFPAIRSTGGVPRGANAAAAGLDPGVPIGPTPVWQVYQPWPLPALP